MMIGEVVSFLVWWCCSGCWKDIIQFNKKRDVEGKYDFLKVNLFKMKMLWY